MPPVGSTSRSPEIDDSVVRASSTFKPTTYGSRLGFQDDASKAIAAVEREWSVDLHEGVPSLTVKALVAGSVVGVFCSFLALYYSLKTGVIPSLNILSGLGGFLLVKACLRLKIFRGIFTPQENAVIQTVAVACYAVSAVGNGFGSGYLAMSYNAYKDLGGAYFPGNHIEDTFELTWPRNLLWCLSLSFFGFFVAFPIRDYVILRQKLPFPSGTVTAYVIKNMHSKGSKTKVPFALMSKFFALAFCAGLFVWAWDGLDGFPIFGVHAMAMYNWSIDFDLGSVGIGSILSPQVNGSMLLGAVLTYGVLQPYIATYQNGPGKWLDLNNLPGDSPYLGLTIYGIFGGLAIMILTGFVTIAMLLYTLGMDCYKNRRQSPPSDAGAQDTEDITPSRLQTVILTEKFRNSRIPVWAPYVGYTVFAVITIILLHVEFKVKWYQTLIAILVIPIFAISNVQGVGRTDWDVSSSYGKIMMFPFGAWNYGGSILPSLALCMVTISGCSNAGTLLQDFKTGFLVGASPNSMFIAQMYGAAIGCFVTPTLFALLSSTFTLPNTTDPHAFLKGIYGTIYRTLAIVVTGAGFSALPKNVVQIALGYMLLALLFIILGVVLPPKYACYVPDPSGLAIGILVPPSVSIEFCLGGLLVWWAKRFDPTVIGKVPYIASGAVAGSGIAVVARCIMSLFNVQPPVTIAYEDHPQTLNGGQWVGAVVFLIIFFAVLMCGAWYWNQCDDEDDEVEILDMKAHDQDTKTHAEQSSFKQEDNNDVHPRKD